MRSRLEAVGESGFQFFGKVTASLTHEIRNVFATIYENAGLLEDLAILSEKGRPLDPARIRSLAGTLKVQAMRGKAISDRMSLLAHSIDRPVSSVDLGEMLETVSSLVERMASMRGVALKAVRTDPPVVIKADPFALENLIWLCVEFGMSASLADKTLTMIPELLGGKAALIRFRGLRDLQGLKEDGSPFRAITACAGKAGAELIIDEEDGTVVLSLPLCADPE
jgi:hypothetical protein